MEEDLPEDDETFTVSLSFPGPTDGVLLEPSNAAVEILEVIERGKEVLLSVHSYCW